MFQLTCLILVVNWTIINKMDFNSILQVTVLITLNILLISLLFLVYFKGGD